MDSLAVNVYFTAVLMFSVQVRFSTLFRNCAVAERAYWTSLIWMVKKDIFFQGAQSRKRTACIGSNSYLDPRFLLILAVPPKKSWRRLWKTIST